ncbi:MAG: hypothetical protein Q7S58_03630 [Candidatus Binatus sp.]|uniref:hypothetical protein n=1 Tax=Candidatus Binatus sp. TaxID=2811406 RepID=UPI002721CF1B|nr:hypothetical protein [Candidatus Binatus sp.]MDO8431480.1 hypothetical protein [Candidatus Binatus sp.]
MRKLFDPVVGWYPPESRRSNLGLNNFFTYGWTEGWSEPEEGPDDAPRFRLLRIQRAFWERELRLTYNSAFRPDAHGNDEQEGEFELELPISRRFLIEFEGGVAAARQAGRHWMAQASDLRITPEVMLIETHRLSFSSGLVVETPTGGRAVEQGRTSLTPYLALWGDLGHRIGLHSYLGSEFPLGGSGSSSPTAVLQYAIAPSITVTPKSMDYLGDLTFFIEGDGETRAGNRISRTTLNLLPGTRWLVFRDTWIAAGYEFPITEPKPFTGRAWVSLYLDF